jgi:hypothetical protein
MNTIYRLPIKSAEDFHHPDKRWGNTTAAERIVLAHWHMETNGFNVTLPKLHTTKVVTHARLDWGRWVVDCPWCASAQHASREDHRFFCVECGNAAVRGQWISVVWPDDAEIARVEELLSCRPSKDNQFWTPTWATFAPPRFAREEIDVLVVENKVHGVK